MEGLIVAGACYRNFVRRSAPHSGSSHRHHLIAWPVLVSLILSRLEFVDYKNFRFTTYMRNSL